MHEGPVLLVVVEPVEQDEQLAAARLWPPPNRAGVHRLDFGHRSPGDRSVGSGQEGQHRTGKAGDAEGGREDPPRQDVVGVRNGPHHRGFADYRCMSCCSRGHR